jgi:hypothetical protein
MNLETGPIKEESQSAFCPENAPNFRGHSIILNTEWGQSREIALLPLPCS